MKIKKKKGNDLYLEDKGCYEVKQGKLIGYTLTDEGLKNNFLFEEGDIICVPEDGIYLRAKTDDVEIVLTKDGPTYQDVIKVIGQIELVKMKNVALKIQAVIKGNRGIDFTHEEIAGYLGLSRETVTRKLGVKT